MPDRYGETPDNPDPDAPDATTPARLHRAEVINAAIEACDLCDADGYLGTVVCPHEDFRPAATRGMANLRRVMGWET